MKAQELLKLVIESKNSSLHHFRMALIKANQTHVLKYISEKPKSEGQNDDIQTSYEGRCMLHLQGDCYVVAKNYKDEVYINIRNYHTTNDKKIPTKQGVSLTLSRWLVLIQQKEYINNVFQLVLTGEKVDEELIHLGGGVYVTLNSKYPTVDLRHFWKPEDSDKAIATKRGIALNNFKWKRLCDVMTVMPDFIPELTNAFLCGDSHNNEIELLAFSECYPFTDKEDEIKEEITQNQEGQFHIKKAMMMIPE